MNIASAMACQLPLQELHQALKDCMGSGAHSTMAPGRCTTGLQQVLYLQHNNTPVHIGFAGIPVVKRMRC